MMVNCGVASQLCYNNTPANMTGLDQLVNYSIQQMGATDSVTGAMINPLGVSMLGLAIIVPLFLILFLILSRYDPKGAVVVSSFVCWIAAIALTIMGMLTNLFAMGFFALFLFSLGWYYMATRN